jgi:hypothetical protein
MMTAKLKISLLMIGLVTLLAGCYYDNEQYLYPLATNPVCDTTTVSFSQQLVPIIQDQCISCHIGSAAPLGIDLSTHQGVATNIEDIIGAISHASGFSPMPAGGNKLSNCDISRFVAWRDHGSQNN